MSTINANTSVLEYERLTGEREFLRLERKAAARRRYERRHKQTGAPRLRLVSDIVTVVYGPLTQCDWAVGHDTVVL